MDADDGVIVVNDNEHSILFLSIGIIDEEVKPIENNDKQIIIIDDSDDSDDENTNSTEINNVINIEENEADELIKRLLLCSICSSTPDEENAVELPNCIHRFCKKCLSKYIKDIGLEHDDYKCPNSECDTKFEIDRWLVTNGVLDEDDFNKYDMYKLKQFVNEEDLYYCPNPVCKCCFLLEDGEIHDEITGETDSEGNVMNLIAIQHRDKYRVRCVKCDTNWCIKCKITPYHLGKTCEEYDEYLKLRKCRYCKKVLEDQNAKIDICISNEECKEKRKRCCNKRLRCGHPCYGIKRCKCLPCLIPECVNKEKEKEENKEKEEKDEDDGEKEKEEKDDDEKKVKVNNNNRISININGVTIDDYCNICWSESLSQSPCVQLDCGHIFHYDCVMERIKNRWNDKRISFNYLNCPLCDRLMSNPVITYKIEEDLSLMKTVKEKAAEYLKIENMLNDKELTDPSSEFYNKPEEYGMKKFVFYLCEECKIPFYAGLASCREGVPGEEERGERRIDYMNGFVMQQPPPPPPRKRYRRIRRGGRGGRRNQFHYIPPPPPPPQPPKPEGRHLPLPKEMIEPPPVVEPVVQPQDIDDDDDYNDDDDYYSSSDEDDDVFNGYNNYHENRIDMDMLIQNMKVDDNKKLCNKCRYKNAKIKPCEIHGFEYAVFKCRYCCNQSVWFCFGTTHFCDSCHNIYQTVQSTPVDKLPKCKGKGKCPSGGNHPPNGVEHYLGCSVCLGNSIKT